MRARLARLSRKAVLFCLPAIIVGTLIAGLIPAHPASAANETLRWIDSANMEMAGPNLRGVFKLTQDQTPGAGMAWSAKGTIMRTEGCKINVNVGVPLGANGAQTDYSKAMLWALTNHDADGCTFSLDTPTPAGQINTREYTNPGSVSPPKDFSVADVNNRTIGGDPNPPQPGPNDPEASQVINVKLVTGWITVYKTPNPSNPPKPEEMVPQEDVWILCGNVNDPATSWDPYRNSVGTADDAKMHQDCLGRKTGWVISTIRSPMLTNPIRYEGKFTGVKAGYYVVCDIITNSCRSVVKEAGKEVTVDSWSGAPNPDAKIPTEADLGNGAAEEPKLACQVTFDITTIFSLKWLVCPIVNAATYAVAKMEDAINDLLRVDTENLFSDTAQDNAFHKAWNSFRLFAIGVVVIAALIMVVSQAAGVEVLDAYTVRKLLPRLLIAAIFIALSWDILEFLVGLSNEAGVGIRTLIYAPFSELASDNELGGGSAWAITLISTGAALFFGWLGLLSFALTGLLAALVAFAILVFRKMLIYFLVMMAPFAIACYVLPNTQKLWETWKTGLASVLIVFPIISAFIAIGRVFSVTAYNSEVAGSEVVNQLISLIAYFAPYFLISLAFRLAGGFVATVGGFVNDRSKGAFDRLKNFRSKKVAENTQKMKEGRRFADRNPLARAFNTTTLGLGTGAKGHFGLGARGAEARDQASRNAKANIQNSAAYKAIQDDDPALEAATYGDANSALRGLMARGHSEAEARRAVNAVHSSIGFGRAQQIAAAEGMINTGTGMSDMQHQTSVLARASGGNASTAASLAGFANFKNKEKGRNDLAPGFGLLHSAVRQEAGLEVGGASAGATPQQRQAFYSDLQNAASRSADPVTLARNRTPGYTNAINSKVTMYQEAMQEYQAAQASGNQRAMHESLLKAQEAERFIHEQEQSRPYANGENNAVLDSVVQQIDAQRDWLGSMGRVDAPTTRRRGDPSRNEQVVITDPATGQQRTILRPEDPNREYTERLTYRDEARASARVMQPRDPNRQD